jgi:hypothetical protein
MSTLQSELHALAEQIAGEPVFVDVVYTIRTAGSTFETTGTTRAAALARFIAELLEADAQDGRPLPVVTAIVPGLGAGVGLRPTPTDVPAVAVAPSNGDGNGNGHDQAAAVAAVPVKAPRGQVGPNRTRVAELYAQGLKPQQIADATGLSLANVKYHLANIRKAESAEVPSNDGGFRG